MKKRLIGLAASLVALINLQASAQSLSVGDDAPALAVARYVKGDKVERLEPDQTYVVEFWATWCGPCIQTIPHLTELQKKYAGKVKFIGVSVFEQDQSKVEPFVKKMGDKMDYSVALDDVAKGSKGGEGKMAKAWMEASESEGIPTAFIVQKGKVAYIGHPMSMSDTLEKVADGKFDMTAAISKAQEEKAAQKKMKDVIEKLQALGNDASPKERVAVLDASIKETPSLETALGFPKYMMMVQGNVDGASEYGSHLVDTTMAANSEALNNLAWLHVAPESKDGGFKLDVKLALKAAIKACELTKNENAPFLDTLAAAYAANDQPAKAVEVQEKAVKIGGQGEDDMQDRLKEYRKAVDAKKKP